MNTLLSRAWNSFVDALIAPFWIFFACLDLDPAAWMAVIIGLGGTWYVTRDLTDFTLMLVAVYICWVVKSLAEDTCTGIRRYLRQRKELCVNEECKEE